MSESRRPALRGYAYRHLDENGVDWTQWWLASGPLLVYVTYQ